MKIQIQRITRSEQYNEHSIDHRLMEGTVTALHPGIELDVQFAHMDEGNWRATNITKIEYAGESMKLVHTKNSVYLIIKGWRED
jgi:hypothetical protein